MYMDTMKDKCVNNIIAQVTPYTFFQVHMIRSSSTSLYFLATKCFKGLSVKVIHLRSNTKYTYIICI